MTLTVKITNLYIITYNVYEQSVFEFEKDSGSQVKPSIDVSIIKWIVYSVD